MKNRDSNCRKSKLPMAAALLVSASPAYASGDLMMIYYAGGALVVQAFLLGFLVAKSTSHKFRWLVISVYSLSALAAWVVAYKLPANFLPILTFVLVAAIPLVITIVFGFFLKWLSSTRNEI